MGMLVLWGLRQRRLSGGFGESQRPSLRPAFFSTSGSAQLTVRAHKGWGGARAMGNGAARGGPSTRVSTPKTRKLGVRATMSYSI